MPDLATLAAPAPAPAPARDGAFAGLATIAHGDRFGLAAAAPVSRFVFRGREAAIAAAGEIFGVALPRQACRSAGSGARAALWLGPDEWLLLAPQGEGGAIAAAFGSLAAPHSLVDIGHRNAALELSGAKVCDVIAAGCPLDLDLASFPVGMSTRTILNKAEIVLWRRAPDRFHLECWRSFAGYVHGFLADAAREFSAPR